MRVFYCDKERVKEAVMEEAKNFCDMIDCVDEPPELRYKVSKHGVLVEIEVSIE